MFMQRCFCLLEVGNFVKAGPARTPVDVMTDEVMTSVKEIFVWHLTNCVF